MVETYSVFDIFDILKWQGFYQACLSKVYLCSGVEVGAEKSYWVTGFSPTMVRSTNTIRDGGSTATHSKAICVWTDASYIESLSS